MLTDMDLETIEDKLVKIRFGIVVFILRMFLHITQDALGKKCKLTRGTICLIEHGFSSVIGRNEIKVIRGLGISRSEFFRYADFDHQMKKLLEKFQLTFSINPSKIEFLYRYWSDNPPMDELNPVKLLFPRCTL